jgi:hypothetical protein
VRGALRWTEILVAGALLVLGCAPVSTADRTEPPASVTGATVAMPQIETSEAPNNRIFASILDQAGNPLTDFKIGNFSIIEGGVPGVPAKVGTVTDPLYVTLVLDRSGSMTAGGKEAAANAGATAFVNSLGADDSIAYIEFSDDVRRVVEFTKDKSAVTTAIAAGVSSGSTALYDAIITGVQVAAEASGRKLLLVLTDGVDSGGGASMADAILNANYDGIGVYTIGLGTDYDAGVLSAIASQTGATNFNTATGLDLSTFFTTTLNQFNNLVYVRYRQKKFGEIKLYLNYGSLTATTTRQMEEKPEE